MSSFFNKRASTVKIPRQALTDLSHGHKAQKRKKLNKLHIYGIIVLLILMGVSVWAIMGRMDFQQVPRLVPNQTASATIYAAIPFSYEDEEETKLLHTETLKNEPLFFRFTSERAESLKEKLSKFISEHEKEYGKQFCEDFTKKIQAEAGRGLISQKDQNKFRNKKFRFMDDQGRCLVEIRKINNADRPEDIAEEIAENITLDHVQKKEQRTEMKAKLYQYALELLSDAVMIYDEALTRKEHEAKLKEIGTLQYEYNRGAVLLRKGAIVTDQDIKRLTAYAKEQDAAKSSLKSKTDWIKLAQSICVAFLLILFTAIYIVHIHPEVMQSGNKIGALGLVILLALLLNILCVKLFSYAGELFSIPPKLWYLALPLGFAPILIACLIGVRTALFAGLFISLVASFSGFNQFNMIVFGMVVSALSSYMIKRCRNYRSLFLRGFFTLSIVSMVLVIIFCWRDGSLQSVMPWPLILPVAVSIMTIVLVQFTLVLLETVFDLSSKISLNLYSDYNHPLLKEMQINAPGTYHHSLIVSILAEAAAESIGADPIMARVGALFHDVGKNYDSEYFTENNKDSAELHKELKPLDSAKIITNHVCKGVKLAREYKLKRPIREAIEQHHGTDLVYYFYMQAKNERELFDEKDFRYGGPRPRSKEVAILSLADACEAASRSLDKPTLGEIEGMVDAIIQKRLKDGQLDECHLTFHELSVIRKSFINTLTSMLHARIAYPTDEEKENEDDLFLDAERQASIKEKS